MHVYNKHLMVKTHWPVPKETEIFYPKESQSLVLKTNHRETLRLLGTTVHVNLTAFPRDHKSLIALL